MVKVSHALNHSATEAVDHQLLSVDNHYDSFNKKIKYAIYLSLIKYAIYLSILVIPA